MADHDTADMRTLDRMLLLNEAVTPGKSCGELPASA